MSALAAARTNLSNKGPILYTIGWKTAASQTIYNGALVAVNTAGKLIPAATTVGTNVVGVVDLGTKVSVVTALDDVLNVKVGIFPFANGTSTDACTDADNTHDVYVLDDQTVGRLPGAGRPIAGQLIKIENSLCFVAIGIRLPGVRNDAGAGTAWQGIGSTETVAAPGALSVLKHETLLSTIDGTDAFTLADGLFVGQEKIIRSSGAGANTPIGTVTPATPFGYATITAIGVLGDACTLVWTASGWMIRALNGVTLT